MLRLIRYCLWLLSRGMLSLRYRVRVRGWEKLDGVRGPVLVLPNHPAYIDPPIVLTALSRRLNPRPLMLASLFENPVLYPVMKLMDALELPDTGRPGRRTRRQVEETIQKLIAGLLAGRNHILWPAGRLQRRGEEVLGGARALGEILAACPDVTVLLVRTEGLWGSMFGFARTGGPPNLVGAMLKGIGLLLANLLFFIPRRRVDITLEVVDRSQLPDPEDRRAFNKWFEAWYNQGPRDPVHVPYHFLFGRRTFDWPPPPAQADGFDPGKIKPEVRDEVNGLLARKLKRPLTDAELRPDVALDELGLDSLDRASLTLAVEQRFGFSGDQAPVTVGGLWALAAGLAAKGEPSKPPRRWFRKGPVGPVEFLAETVPEAFVARALASRNDVAVADDLAGRRGRPGALTYGQLLARAMMLARRLKKLPGTNVGVLLPASSACDLALMGLQLAGKVPVVMNWTTGQAGLEHAARLLGLKHVVTADAFLDRLDLPDLEGVRWAYLDDLCEERTGGPGWAPLRPFARAFRKLGLGFELLRTSLRVRWRPGSVRAATPRPSPDDPAVVLFTSGSEKAPKAVPLTHRNLIANQRAAAEVLKVTRADSILGFLPAFHSFGLSVTGLLPLLGGLRVVRHPDPTDARALVRKTADYRVTLMCATPTFLTYLLGRIGDPGPDGGGPLSSLRLVVVGAERCPKSLFDDFGKVSRAALLEGYGITECAPVVSVNPPDAPRPGTVGKPLPGIEACAVELVSPGPPAEFGDRLPAGQQGMLLVSGPSVFPGYLGEADSPFRELFGRRWYVTGDLAEIDADGYIRLAGRLKRFIKVGGEMVSLPELEGVLVGRYPAGTTPDGMPVHRVAVEGVELDGGHIIALFSTEPLTLGEANEVLEQKGLRGVKRLTEVRQVSGIPTLGAGKVDYKALKAKLTP